MTKYECSVKFCRAYDPTVLVGPVKGDGKVFSPKGLRWLPSKTSVPLVVNHDETRVIGEVQRVSVLPWIDQRWMLAHCIVTDPPPWLRKGTRASFSYKPLNSYELWGDNPWTVVTDAILDEVTVVGPGFQPVEPLAEVLSFREAAGEEVIWGNGQLVRRYFPATITVR